MGKGDKKTKKGKIQRGSYGVRRPRIKKRPRLEDKLDPNKKVKPKS
ncbi:30S ribosomal protein THX [Xanthomarina sp. F1114]|nr:MULTISPECIES: 30S ribosomal protein THX [unclassified Xanthomarina]MCX7547617.1 30S ribosomal protein THX [Xanthomarina sp. F1114]MCX7549282.1 30S ribosomal protein THX [Xanthomarina sp. F2636L]